MPVQEAASELSSPKRRVPAKEPSEPPAAKRSDIPRAALIPPPTAAAAHLRVPPLSSFSPRKDRAEESSLAEDSLARVFLVASKPLCAVFSGRSLSAALAEAEADLPPPLRAQVHELVYGVLRRQGWGDALLERLLSKPGLEAGVRALLLLALYRMESRPEAAYLITDNAVNAAGVLSQGKAGGLVNAVLRNYSRRRTELLAEIENDMAVQYCHPAWWLRRLRTAYPDDWKRICLADNAQPPLTLRVNTRRITRADYLQKLTLAGIDAVAMEDFSQAIRLMQAVRVDTLPGFSEGLFAVQDAGAQRAVEYLDVQDGQRVLDACAAPGGKSTHILQNYSVDLLALDIDARRCTRIEENFQRLGLQATLKVGDAAQPASWWDGQPFDRILLDVPCSASGVVRRHPDAKWLRRSADIAALAQTQQSLLAASWSLLAPGGKLLYATCSVFPQENGEQIRTFLAKHTDAQLIELLPGQVLGVQLLPNAVHDGFYFALLLKHA